MFYLKSFLNYIPSKTRLRVHSQLNSPLSTLETFTQKKPISSTTPRGTSKAHSLPYVNSFSSNFFTTTLLPSAISFLNELRITLLNAWKCMAGEGFLQIKVASVVFIADALISDDEPIWEPVEWSLIQTWILYTFLFAWIAENLITSRYGSYTGRDKRVWFAWYKTAWMVIAYYALTIGAASLFVMIPFYHEVSSMLPLTVSWWDWYSRTFFTSFIGFFTVLLILATFLQITIRWFNWKKTFLMIVIINLLLLYLLFGQFFLAFFSYTTDPNWYNKARLVDYIQLSHEPNKWSWGSSKRDHFSYHKSSTVFWFKGDLPFAQAFQVIQIYFLWSLFGVAFFWWTFLRRVYATKEVSYTYATYALSTLKQFFYFFFMFLAYILFSYVITYWRLPVEFLWMTNSTSWFVAFADVVSDYPSFLTSLFK